MFPTFVDEETDQLKLLTEKYHKYKREYLKHLCFNPEGENLSKYFITLRDEAYAGPLDTYCTSGPHNVAPAQGQAPSAKLHIGALGQNTL